MIDHGDGSSVCVKSEVEIHQESAVASCANMTAGVNSRVQCKQDHFQVDRVSCQNSSESNTRSKSHPDSSIAA